MAQISVTGGGADPVANGVVEEVVAKVWEETLGRVPARDDDFFVLGGHSLAAARASVRVGQMLGVQPDLELLFERPQLRQYAAALAALVRRGLGIPEQSITPVCRTGPLPLSYLQANRLLREQRAAAAGAPTHPMLLPLLVGISGSLTEAEVSVALDRVLARHEALRTGFDLGHGPATAFVANLPASSLTCRDLGPTAPADRARHLAGVLAEMTRTTLRRDEPPLMRAVLCRFGPAEAVLVIVVDHLVADGWSIDILFADLAASLGGTELPALPSLGYLDWAAWQRARLSGDLGTRLLGFWRGQLAGTVVFPPLPLPGPATEQVAPGRAEIVVRITGPELAGLHAVSSRAGVTMFMIALTAVARTWARETGLGDMVIHSPTANRGLAATEGVIGWFAHSLCYRMTPDLSADPVDAVAATRHTVVQAFAHQEVPLPLLVNLLQPHDHGRARRPARLFLSYERSGFVEQGGSRIRRLDVPLPDPVAEPGLSFNVAEGSGWLTVHVVYDGGEVVAEFADAVARGLDGELRAVAAGGVRNKRKATIPGPSPVSTGGVGRRP